MRRLDRRPWDVIDVIAAAAGASGSGPEGADMGKAGVGLPDPLDSTAGSAGAAATDDLLAQLAGEEIDRLLADADDASPAAASTGLPSTDADVALGVPPASPTPAESSEKDPLTLLDEVQKRANAVEQTVKELAPPTPAKKGDG
ncbi:MAG TPA: hypothetical protein VK324_02215, partial [Tepidisphaeraceae bacterium]|nr:hypothetical protein [Tepidisphaeraceae bacterium]